MTGTEANADTRLSPLQSVLKQRSAARAEEKKSLPLVAGPTAQSSGPAEQDGSENDAAGPNPASSVVSYIRERTSAPVVESSEAGGSSAQNLGGAQSDKRQAFRPVLPGSPLEEPEVKTKTPLVRAHGPGRYIQRRGLLLSFLLMVVLPALVATVYYVGFAADQYVSEVRFAVRLADRGAARDTTGTGGSIPSATIGVADSFIIADYITTRQFIDEVEARVGLRKMFSHESADFWARLDPNSKIEELGDYWRSVVSSRFDLSTGILSVKVRAFTPDDSLKLAQAVLDSAEQLANQLTERSRRDFVISAEGEVKKAEARLLQSQAKLREFRQREGVLDPTKVASSNADLAAKLKGELTTMKAEFELVSSTMLPTAPPVRDLTRRIKAAEQQIKDVETDALGHTGGLNRHLESTIAQFESLEMERGFAEKNFGAALDDLQRARMLADRQQVYLANFAKPALPEASQFPNRPASIALIVGLCFIAWAVGLLIVLGIRDHVR